MIFAWTKQFLLATGLFALVLTGQTLNMVVKEQHVAKKQLKDSYRTVRIPAVAGHHIN